MNKLVAVLLVIMLSSSVNAVFAAKQDYKCFINSSSKGKEVVFYSWDSKDLLLKMKSLLGKQRVDVKGKKYFIKNVEECVPLSEEFSSKQAKEQDKRTLR
ncbi:TapY2 family type IVa secretion system protein [Shewanella alkalitolerans]|uniref:TapY2 family type IVa secretion system protein n=1 Tax=Shewanella alkalitolerans TaxID=2864209 RepID=UPI001C65D983|nr:TapY2 family type IVa secretion system protein [Shewanella alkalitolerans]QYJ98703.1 TapY2 family type IVa secretion system protein [Shewanella alkalitolerans]